MTNAKTETTIGVPKSTAKDISDLAEWEHRTMKGQVMHIVEEYVKDAKKRGFEPHFKAYVGGENEKEEVAKGGSK